MHNSVYWQYLVRCVHWCSSLGSETKIKRGFALLESLVALKPDSLDPSVTSHPKMCGLWATPPACSVNLIMAFITPSFSILKRVPHFLSHPWDHNTGRRVLRTRASRVSMSSLRRLTRHCTCSDIIWLSSFPGASPWSQGAEPCVLDHSSR